MALILVGYAVVGSYFSVVIGRRLVGLNYYQERYQADFRFGLVHVRENVEPIFIYGGEQHESEQLRHRFSKVVGNFKQLIRWQRNLGFFTESYGGVVTLFPYWFLAAPMRRPPRVRAGGAGRYCFHLAELIAVDCRNHFSVAGRLRQSSSG